MAPPQKKVSRVRTPAQRRRENKRRRDARRDAKNEGKVEAAWNGAAPIPETGLRPITGDDVRHIVREELGKAIHPMQIIRPGRNDHEGVAAAADDCGDCAKPARNKTDAPIRALVTTAGRERDRSRLEIAADRILSRSIDANNIRNLVQQLTMRITGTMMPVDPSKTDGDKSNAPLHLLDEYSEQLSYQLEQLRQEVEFLNAHL